MSPPALRPDESVQPLLDGTWGVVDAHGVVVSGFASAERVQRFLAAVSPGWRNMQLNYRLRST